MCRTYGLHCGGVVAEVQQVHPCDELSRREGGPLARQTAAACVGIFRRWCGQQAEGAHRLLAVSLGHAGRGKICSNGAVRSPHSALPQATGIACTTQATRSTCSRHVRHVAQHEPVRLVQGGHEGAAGEVRWRLYPALGRQQSGRFARGLSHRYTPRGPEAKQAEEACAVEVPCHTSAPPQGCAELPYDHTCKFEVRT